MVVARASGTDLASSLKQTRPFRPFRPTRPPDPPARPSRPSRPTRLTRPIRRPLTHQATERIIELSNYRPLRSPRTAPGELSNFRICKGFKLT